MLYNAKHACKRHCARLLAEQDYAEVKFSCTLSICMYAAERWVAWATGLCLPARVCI